MKTSVVLVAIFGALGMFLFFTNKQEMKTHAAYLEQTKPERVARPISAKFTTSSEEVHPHFTKEYGFLEMQNRHLTGLPSDYFDGYEGMVRGLYLQNNELKTIPSNIRSLKKLIGINLSSNKITNVSNEFFQFANNLRNLDLSYNKLMGQFKLMSYASLDNLKLEGNQITHLFVDRGQSIKDINLMNNRLSDFPTNLSRVHDLTTLNLSKNQITSLRELDDPKRQYTADDYMFDKLTSLNLSSNQLTTLPGYMNRMPYLEELFLEDNNIRGTLELKGYHYLEELRIENQYVERVIISGGSRLTAISMEANEMSSFEISNDLHYLGVINLNTNNLYAVPKGMDKCSKLENVFLTNNQLSDFSNLRNCYQLEALYLDENNLKVVPYISTSGKSKLNHLDVSYNEIRTLDLNKIDVSLETLTLHHNDIRSIKNTSKKLNIRDLDLSNNQKLSSFSTGIFKSLPKLKYLNIAFTSIKSRDIEKIRKYCKEKGIDLITADDL